MNDLMHYAERAITFDRSRSYEQREPYETGKPDGLWVSVPGEDDWPTWCHDSEYGDEDLAVAHHVELNPTANILYVATADDLDKFHTNYSTEGAAWASGIGDDEWRFRQRPIDWRLVAKDHDGIIIAPYQWSRRLMGPFWYYGWDCASGCIWSTAAIKSIVVL